MRPSCPRLFLCGFLQDHEVLMRHRAVKPEWSNRETPAERGDLSRVDGDLRKAESLREFRQDSVRFDAIAADDVVGDDVDRMATRLQDSQGVFKDSFQVCIEGAEPREDGLFRAE